MTITQEELECVSRDIVEKIMALITLPCQMPCPKCGSTDIARKFHFKDERWDDRGVGEKTPIPNEFFDWDLGRFEKVAKQDLINHHCTCCQYKWQTDALNIKPRPKSRRDKEPQTKERT